MGVYVHGHLFGEFILKCEGNSYIIGTHPAPSKTGESKDLRSYCTYIYPDLESCISGVFKYERNAKGMDVYKTNADLRLESGMYGKIMGLTWSNGFALPKSSSSVESLFSYDPSTGLRIRYVKLLVMKFWGKS